MNWINKILIFFLLLPDRDRSEYRLQIDWAMSAKRQKSKNWEGSSATESITQIQHYFSHSTWWNTSVISLLFSLFALPKNFIFFTLTYDRFESCERKYVAQKIMNSIPSWKEDFYSKDLRKILKPQNHFSVHKILKHFSITIKDYDSSNDDQQVVDVGCRARRIGELLKRIVTLIF